MKNKHPIGIFYVIVLIQFCCLGFSRGNSCPALQYLELGHVGTISCVFVDGFTLIAWYDSLDYKQTDPVIELRGTTKSGVGLRSNEYDVDLNGSLIINDVTINHETTFTVRVFRSNQEFPSTFHTDVIATVTPNKQFPVIYSCLSPGETVCVSTSREDSEFVCGIEGAKPGIPVSWLSRTPDGDRNISINYHSNHDSHLTNHFTSVRDPFTDSSLLALLVCQAEDKLQMLKRNESMILVENHETHLPITPDKVINIKQGNTLQLQCTNKSLSIFLWKRIKTSDDVVAYGIRMKETITKVYEEHYNLGRNGSLLIPSVTVSDEGSYACIYNDGNTEGTNLVDVSVIINPEPSYLSVAGCNPDTYCTLQIKQEDILKCEVKGIRPIVTLEWRVLGEEFNVLKFGDQINTITKNKDTSDVTLTTQFIANPTTTTNRVRVECLATGENAHLFHLSIVLDLILLQGVEPQTATPVPDKNGPSTFIIIFCLLVSAGLLALGIVLIYFVYGKATRRAKPKLHEEEKVAMLNQDRTSPPQDKKIHLINQLKGSYENLYGAIQPVPYLTDRIAVNSIFVEGGVEYLVKDKTIKNCDWQPLESYKCIRTDSRISSTRHIIEAEPGYGKSTLTLQLAYEWCDNVKGSILENVDILILLKLRQLKGVCSIYDAIKRFILPRDSSLTIEDIKTILLNEDSVFVILDGFDEFNHVDTASKSDVLDILNRRMFTSFEVILTTRSSCLPNDYAPQTKRIRLTGFGKTAQDKYLKKVVTKEDETSRIKEALNDNPVLVDLCQVPLFFVMFAHLYCDNEDIRNCTSVTKFFRYLISCLHNHFKRKMEDQNVEITTIFNHKALDKVAFESLTINGQQDEWKKGELVELLGKEFIEQYLNIGVLRGFKFTETVDDPGTLESDHVQSIIKIKFYHSLFCEWYAAHYIADKIEENIINEAANPIEILESLDPNKFDFVYRFACGINQNAAKAIIQYLQDMKGRNKFAMLCILEQSGSVDQIIHNVERLCCREILIGSQDTRLLHRSIIQIMEIASSKAICIQSLWLENCVEYAENWEDGIVLKSTTIRVPFLKTLRELCIEERGRIMKKDELEKILQYCLKCYDLQIIKFNRCLLPYSLEMTSSISKLKERNLKVLWYPQLLWYQLNLDTGTWKFKESDLELQHDEYKKEMEGIQEMSRSIENGDGHGQNW